jgi:membrane-associated phospholipid phosphatase
VDRDRARERQIRPVDLVLAAFNAVAAVAWTAAWGRTPAAPWMILAHVAGVSLPWLVARVGPRSPAWIRALREGYPLLLLYPFYSEAGLLHAALGSPGHDAVVAGGDRALFGTAWHRQLHALAPQRWISETMHFFYASYYLLLAGPPIAAALARNGGAFRDISLRQMATFTACFAVYLYFPVYGPGHMDPFPTGGRPEGFFADLVRAAIGSGDSPGTAFPSSHVAGALTAAWFARRWYPRSMAALTAVGAVGVAFGTVYTRNHYAIDAAAGAALAIALQTAIDHLDVKAG